MFVRIVKMSFHEDLVDRFLDNFNQNKAAIRSFEGCKLLELYRDKTNANQFFTYSYWEHVDDLENYRNSELFKKVWSETKVLFNAKPEAWSVDKYESLV
ncbi:MAG: antibiotic biosynthesis monooxygenase [Mangrovimonas sp.]|nr:antibiotic biosynthesis monooxygenase [Mangrovimonas sp.]MCB0438542.1 antibiotic biosynthesis monooxygenase [Mangrovimonas sp.]HRV56410.1 antibiotic biosynthesis monooxygenase [Mangrovimonas sp.]